MERIVAIIDMDGFQVEKKFFCKELGVIKVGETIAESFLFDLGIRRKDLTKKQRVTCDFVTRHIHHLSFDTPRSTKTFPIEALEGIVRDFYFRFKTNDASCIAYKGGHFEGDLLGRLNIPSVNLEYFGCPKAELLFNSMMWLETCGNHLRHDSYNHCPKAEVEAFALWLRNQL